MFFKFQENLCRLRFSQRNKPFEIADFFSLTNLHSLTFDSYHAPMWMLIISIQQEISQR